MDLLISKLLSKSILDLGKWSNWKYANKYFCIFSLITSWSPKLISKAVLKWEGPYFYCKNFWSVLTNNKKKVEKWIFHCIFKSCTEGLGEFFHARAQIFSPKAFYLPTKQPWGAPNFWFWLCPFIRTGYHIFVPISISISKRTKAFWSMSISLIMEPDLRLKSTPVYALFSWILI